MIATANLSETLHNLFRHEEAGSPLANVRCLCDDKNLILTGSVSRFDYVQTAIDMARKLAQGRHVDIRIDVICPAPPKGNESPACLEATR